MGQNRGAHCMRRSSADLAGWWLEYQSTLYSCWNYQHHLGLLGGKEPHDIRDPNVQGGPNMPLPTTGFEI